MPWSNPLITKVLRRTSTGLAALAAFAGTALGDGTSAGEAQLPHVVVAASGERDRAGFDGVVEAVRQTVLAGQIAGAIVALDVKAGDAVKAGQVLARIDARAAEQNAAASDAQVAAARAALEVATRDVERQRLLFQKRYISEAALERAEAQFKSSRALVDAQLAQAGAARTQTGFHTLKAPYAGIVTDVPVALGDMAMPGRPIATLYDPAALRVSASIPLSAVPSNPSTRDATIEIPRIQGLPALRVAPTRIAMLPTADPTSHTVTLRLDLPAGTDLRPGAFARVWITAPRDAAPARLSIPLSVVVRRAELAAVYVLDAGNRPLLRQIRLGRTVDGQVEVLSGIAAGERVVTAPGLATRAAAAAGQSR